METTLECKNWDHYDSTVELLKTQGFTQVVPDIWAKESYVVVVTIDLAFLAKCRKV